MKDYLITFIIPAYNRTNYLIETLGSIDKQKISKQVIVIDDGSDKPLSNLIIREFPEVIVIRNDRNYGPSTCRNMGIEAARGQFICFIDSDDILEDDFSEKMLKEISNSGNAVLCLSKVIVENDNKIIMKIIYNVLNFCRNIVLYWWYHTNNKHLKMEGFFAASLSRMIFPIVNIEKLRFNETMKNAEDWEFLIRYMYHRNVNIAPYSLVRFRYSNSSLTHLWRKRTKWKYYYKVINMLPDIVKGEPILLFFRYYIALFKNIE